MTKILSGTELVGYIKNRQVKQTRQLLRQGITPTLAILRDSDNPVIAKYVQLKKRYGADLGARVLDLVSSDLASTLNQVNADPTVHGVIIQLPTKDSLSREQLDHLLRQIAPAKDVDGLNPDGETFYSATATAINWLLAGYDIDLANRKIAIVGRGRLVGGPLIKLWRRSGYDLTVFDHTSDLTKLKEYDIIETATGVPRLITSEMVKPGAIVIDAGTASENGVLVGDVDETVRARSDLTAITPKIGGVGPLTVTVLFDYFLLAAAYSS